MLASVAFMEDIVYISTTLLLVFNQTLGFESNIESLDNNEAVIEGDWFYDMYTINLSM